MNLMARMKHQPPTPLSPSMPTSMSLQDDILPLPMTPPDPADPPHASTVTKDAASVVTAIHVIATERAALANLEHLYQTDRLAQENLARAVNQIVRSVQNGGKLVVCGVGKSGKIGKKVEATMNSMGIHSSFLHPTEALHGDLGLIRPIDTLLLISFSGRTPELLLLLPHIPPTVPVIAITSHMHPSTCPLLSFHPPEMGFLLPAPIHEDEESSFGVCAPTSSTTVALSLGDALAIAAARKLHPHPGRGPAEVFKGYHPGGAIGAAFAVSTPMSISTSASTTSFTSMPSDYLQSKSVSQSASPEIVPSPPPERVPLITELIVPVEQIPTVSSPNQVRLLDILLTAIQHPNSKSWVSLSPVEIIPPRNVRALSKSSNVDTNVSDFTSHPFSVYQKDWFCVSSSRTVDEVRQLVSDARMADPHSAVTVVAVMKEEEPDTCLGVLEAEDLWGDCG